RVALDHDIEAPIPAVAAGAEDHVPVAAQVDSLLLAGAGTEVQGVAGPHSHQRRHVRPAIGPDSGNPEQFGLLQRPAGLLPSGRGRVRAAEALVRGGYGGRHDIYLISGQPRLALPPAAAPC